MEFIKRHVAGFAAGLVAGVIGTFAGKALVKRIAEGKKGNTPAGQAGSGS